MVVAKELDASYRNDSGLELRQTAKKEHLSHRRYSQDQGKTTKLVDWRNICRGEFDIQKKQTRVVQQMSSC